jgi:hypothetical protein
MREEDPHKQWEELIIQGGITRAASHAQGKVRNASDKVRDRVKTLRE